MTEDKDINKFVKNFNNILENITKKQIEIKDITKNTEFKATEQDLNKAKKELKELKGKQKKYKGETDKDKKYMSISSKKKRYFDQIEETKIFLKK